jgi:hypothetical protein
MVQELLDLRASILAGRYEEALTLIDELEAMGVPELWIYRNKQLKIYLLSSQGYTETSISPTFPSLPIIELIPQLVQKAIDDGTSKMLRDLRTENWIL